MKPGLQQVCACLLTVLDVSEGLAFPKAPPCPNADSKTLRKLDVEIFNLTDIFFYHLMWLETVQEAYCLQYYTFSVILKIKLI